MSELYSHQVTAVEFLERVKAGGLFDEMGCGKTFCTIATAKKLFEAGELTTMIVIVPASVRIVWFDEELGELAKHHDLPLRVVEYHRKPKYWQRGKGNYIAWFITNYDYLRAGDSTDKDPAKWTNMKPLIEMADDQTWLVLDESSAVKNYKAKQTRAVKALRKVCGRVTLLNGTPISHSPMDLYSQADIMDPAILNLGTGFIGFSRFRRKYALIGGFKNKQIVGWYHPFKDGCCTSDPKSRVHCPPGEGLEDLQARMAPFVLRREKKDVLDLPEKLPPVTLEVRLTPKTWKVYKQMKDEFVAWLDQATSAEAPQAIVRTLRLAQITSGFLGGVQKETQCDCGQEGMTFDKMIAMENAGSLCRVCSGTGIFFEDGEIQTVGSEKHDAVRKLLEERWEAGEKVLLWCRFRWEVERWLNTVDEVPIGAIWGNQRPAERQDAIRLLDPRTAPTGPALVVGTPASGSMGLNLVASWCVVYQSNDHSLKVRLQSEDRVHRMGQTNAVSYFDAVAVGPDGQKTYDHTVVKSLQKKQHIAKMTIDAWKKEMEDEN